MVKDVLVFDSDAFSVEPSLDDRGRRYDLPLGDDIAAYLIERLEAGRTAWKIDGPVKEDYGAVIMLGRGKEVVTITVSWQGGTSWALVFDQMRGCLGWFFNRKPAAAPLREVKLMVHDLVVGDAGRFANAKWIADSEFPGLASSFAIPDSPQ